MVDAPDQAGPLIAGHYAIDWTRPLPFGGGGLPAYAVTDLGKPRQDLMAIQVQPRLPPRASALQSLSVPIPGVLSPIAHGPAAGPAGQQAYAIITQAPPGPPLEARPWSETELLHHVLRPAARSLDKLRASGLTHRGIRPDNVFRAGPGQPVVLGAAWAAPPAAHQLAIAEPPYSAMCIPAGRGNGSIADDVYALGVLLLTLILGRQPLAGLDDQTIIRRKLELGSFAALAGDIRLPPVIADLLRGMLAEDPEHRPTPAHLAESTAARARRLATAPPSRAQQSLQIAGTPVLNTRLLAYAIAVNPELGLQALRAGAADLWLRRDLGDPAVAMRLEEALRPRRHDDGDAVAPMRVIAALDPLAPLCWRGIALWPDGLGPALAAAEDTAPLIELTASEAIGAWARARAGRCDVVALQSQARQQRGWLARRGGDGVERMLYLLNPLLPCASSLTAGAWVAGLADLLPVLERAAEKVDRGKVPPVDRHVMAFVAARASRREMDIPASDQPGGNLALVALRLFATLQQHYHAAPLPGLAAWIAENPDGLLSGLTSRPRRSAAAQRLAALAKVGHLAPMLTLVQDPIARAADISEFKAASVELTRIDTELASLKDNTAGRSEQAHRWGQELAAGIGLAAVAIALLVAALGWSE